MMQTALVRRDAVPETIGALANRHLAERPEWHLARKTSTLNGMPHHEDSRDYLTRMGFTIKDPNVLVAGSAIDDEEKPVYYRVLAPTGWIRKYDGESMVVSDEHNHTRIIQDYINFGDDARVHIMHYHDDA